MSEDFSSVLQSQYSPGNTPIWRQLWPLRLETTIEVGKKSSFKSG